MSEELRIKLKFKRDYGQRNVSKEYIANQISVRSEDSKKFIKSQSKIADIVFETKEINPHEENIGELELKVETHGLNFLQDLSYYLRLYTSCDLDFQMATTHTHKLILKNFKVEIEVLDKIYGILVPGKDQMFYENYKLTPGLQGVMTLVSILGLSEKRVGTKEITHDK
jgi:hypothetical protein